MGRRRFSQKPNEPVCFFAWNLKWKFQVSSIYGLSWKKTNLFVRFLEESMARQSAFHFSRYFCPWVDWNPGSKVGFRLVPSCLITAGPQGRCFFEFFLIIAFLKNSYECHFKKILTPLCAWDQASRRWITKTFYFAKTRRRVRVEYKSCVKLYIIQYRYLVCINCICMYTKLGIKM